MAMFIRVKRRRTTYFLHCDPSETVLETKHKLHALSDVPVDHQRLVLLASQAILDDNKSLADQKEMLKKTEPHSISGVHALSSSVVIQSAAILYQVENDAVVALTLKVADTGDWEEVNIEKPADHANLIDSELS